MITVELRTTNTVLIILILLALINTILYNIVQLMGHNKVLFIVYVASIHT